MGAYVAATRVHTQLTASAEHVIAPALGVQTISALEKGNATANVTTVYQGGNDDMLLTAQYMG